MPHYFLGLDGGGSKTSVVIINEAKEIVSQIKGSGSNFHLLGARKIEALFTELTLKAISEAGIEKQEIRCAVWGIAGAGRAAEKAQLEAIRAAIFPNTPGSIVNDAACALAGGSQNKNGIVLISGTGSIAYGENNAGINARAGGWGHSIDVGSGYNIAIEAIKAVTSSADGKQLPTNLTQEVLNAFGLSKEEEIVGWLYDPDRKVSDVAVLAPRVLIAAEAGDLAAMNILLSAANALTANVASVSNQLGFKDRCFPLVLTGGLLENSGYYRSLITQSILTRIPNALPQLPKFNAAVGAAFIAQRIFDPNIVLSGDDEIGSNVNWATEERNVLTNDLDLLPTQTFVGVMSLEDDRAVNAVKAAIPNIAIAIDQIADRLKTGGRLIYIGAGTSGRLGVLDASECPPTFNSSPNMVIGVIAGGKNALTDAVEAAEDSAESGKMDLEKMNVSSADAVVGIAASGRTPYVLGGLAYAKAQCALTVSITSNLPAPMANAADIPIPVLVGPEVLAGSTRLKSGSAQKMVLNMISTGVMVKLGKTYGNLMVDVSQHNAKLRERAVRIVGQACNADADTARQALEATGRDIRAAIVMLKLNCSPKVAKEKLGANGGNIRKAIGV